MIQSERILEIYDWVSQIPPVDAGHDLFHLQRVAKHAVLLLEDELLKKESRKPTDDEIDAVMAAAYLHDCVPVAKNSPLRKESSRLCSEKAAEYLRIQKNKNGSRAWSESWIAEIAGAILDHSFSSGRIPRSLIGECLQDADRLEALGAIGLYRTIATGVSMGALLFDPSDPWAEKRSLNDKRFSIDHFFTKLLKLPDSFRTEAGKNEANRRSEFLKDFVTQLKNEI